MAEEPEYGRRHFIKDSVLSLAKTAHEFVKHRDAPTVEKTEVPLQDDWLRPPGAVEEPLFLERCTRCGDCVKACPHRTISLSRRDGTPEVFPDEVPCYLCEDFPCIAACGTEALLPLTGRDEVNMGLARVAYRTCTAGQGCHACVPQCPMNALTMDFESYRLVVTGDRCVGCGLCEQICKTVNDKIAIEVIPARLLER
jgi:ferredoxin-type protein NapG